MTPMEAAIPTNRPEAPPEPAEPGTGLGQRSQGVKGAEPATAAMPETDERDESGKYLSREAAGYRRRLRDTEAERDGLRERLERYERGEVERIAGQSGLAVPSDVWIHGATVDTLRGEDGSIDAETVSGLVSDIIKDRPGLQAQKAGNLGLGYGGSTPGAGARVGLSALLKPDR